MGNKYEGVVNQENVNGIKLGENGHYTTVQDVFIWGFSGIAFATAGDSINSNLL